VAWDSIMKHFFGCGIVGELKKLPLPKEVMKTLASPTNHHHK